MKKETLEKISTGKYFVDKNCTYKKGVGKICNFYISDLTIYERAGEKISFEITLKNSKKLEETMRFPISYLYDPMSWFYYGFDIEDFRIETTKAVFEKSMVQINNIIIDNDKYDVSENYIGWYFEKENEFSINERTSYYFGEFENPGEQIDINEYIDDSDVVFEYLTLADISISAPLMSYMLLSVLTGLKFFGTNVKADFNIALVGGTKELRRKFALFFTNLYKRDPSFLKDEYELFHINKNDTTTDIRYKATNAKDCVIIAFEPDTRHLNILLNEIYKTNVIDDKRPIENLLLFTSEYFEKRKSGKTLVIKLDDSHNTEAIENYFDIKYIESADGLDAPTIINSFKDKLIDNIYCYISKLMNELEKDGSYVQREFEIQKNIFQDVRSGMNISEDAKDIALLLCFGFYMYTKCFPVQNFEVCNEVYTAIFKSVESSFPADENFENAKITCRQIDSYFNSEKNRSFIGEIGCEELPSEKSVWFDDEYIYIRQIRISEFLRLTDSKLKYNINVRKALANKEIIKTYIKKDGKIEYSVHLQKVLGIEKETVNSKNTPKCKKQTQSRYIAFDRKKCRQYNLFPNIEKTIVNRCQIDVKTEKNKVIREE